MNLIQKKQKKYCAMCQRRDYHAETSSIRLAVKLSVITIRSLLFFTDTDKTGAQSKKNIIWGSSYVNTR